MRSRFTMTLLSLGAAASLAVPGIALARQGNDDPVKHVRSEHRHRHLDNRDNHHRRGNDDGARHVRGGGDDGVRHVRGGGDDSPNHR
jgi:hypothetical protein